MKNTPSVRYRYFSLILRDKSHRGPMWNTKHSDGQESFTHTSAEFYHYGTLRPSQVERAIENSLKILLNMNIDSQRHFQNMWIGSPEGLVRSWEMSDTAFRLTMVSLATHSPEISEILLRALRHIKIPPKR